jgi:hypothetical protein
MIILVSGSHTKLKNYGYCLDMSQIGPNIRFQLSFSVLYDFYLLLFTLLTEVQFPSARDTLYHQIGFIFEHNSEKNQDQ